MFFTVFKYIFNCKKKQFFEKSKFVLNNELLKNIKTNNTKQLKMVLQMQNRGYEVNGASFAERKCFKTLSDNSIAVLYPCTEVHLREISVFSLIFLNYSKYTMPARLASDW